MAGAGGGEFLQAAAVYLGAAVVAAPIFKRLNLGSVLGYLTAGVIIGPMGLGLAAGEGEAVAVGEFGVVLLLFVIGLELKPTRLWRLRYEVFGLGACQVLVTGLVVGALGYWLGVWGLDLDWREAIVAGAGLALSSTAYAIQILREKGELATPYGDRSFAVLLFQDLAIVPLIALVAVLAPPQAGAEAASPIWRQIAEAVAAVAVLYFAGRYALKPLFRFIAATKAEEIFTAAALLVVVAAALMMDAVGLSMALGAFIAGVLLAETEFRNQLETDIEPFRGLLMGLFFMAVGMQLDLGLLIEHLGLIVLGVVALVSLKAGLLFVMARIAGSDNRDALRIGAVLCQGGEFGFVLFGQAAASGLLGAEDASLLNAVIILSMAVTPLMVMAADRIAARMEEDPAAGGPLLTPADMPAAPAPAARFVVEQAADGAQTVASLSEMTSSGEAQATRFGASPNSGVIVAGFGRFGQVVARILRLRGYAVTLIDNSPRRIRMAETFGNRVYFGDARRTDTLATAGGDDARAIFLCIDDRDGARLAVERIRHRFPGVTIFASTYDRFSMMEMEKAGAHVVERETYESAINLARRALDEFGDGEIADELVEEFRRVDAHLLKLQAEFGAQEGLRKLREGFSLEKAGG